MKKLCCCTFKFSKFYIILFVLFIIYQTIYKIKNCHVTFTFVMCCICCLAQYHIFNKSNELKDNDSDFSNKN